MTDRKYLVAGTATGLDGVTKVRWANDLVARVKILVKKGFTNIDMLEFPYPMNKREGLAYLKQLGKFEGEALAAIDLRIDEFAALDNRVSKPRGRPPKAAKTISLTEIRARKSENIMLESDLA